MAKLEVGQIVYSSLNSGHEIERIGKKYFYVKGKFQKLPISIDKLAYIDTMYSQRSIRFYLTQKEISDTSERNKLLSALRLHFNDTASNKDSLEQLRQIANILGLK